MPSAVTSGVVTRVEYHHKYQLHEELGFWYAIELLPYENPVQIFAPNGARIDWWVVVPRTGLFHRISGVDAEARCFAIAAGFITQIQDPVSMPEKKVHVPVPHEGLRSEFSLLEKSLQVFE